MTITCWIGWHDWLRIDYYHRPSWRDPREYGGLFTYRCSRCPAHRRDRPRRSRYGWTIRTGELDDGEKLVASIKTSFGVEKWIL